MFSCFVIPFRCLFGVCEFRGVHKTKPYDANEIEQDGVKIWNRERERERFDRKGKDRKRKEEEQKEPCNSTGNWCFSVLFLFWFGNGQK